MKKAITLSLILLLITISAYKSNAQFVTIPDSNFVTWLKNHGYSACFNGNQMDTTCNTVVNATYLNCGSDSISNLTGISYFDHLISLYCYGNQLTNLPTLPVTLINLDCSANQLTSLPALPPLLFSLLCYNNQLTFLPPLPSTLNKLTCSGNQLTSLPALPSNINHIECISNQLTFLPAMPNSLAYLHCANNLITTLPSLPSSLNYLYCEDNQLTSLPVLPNSLKDISCGNNYLTSIPTLPQGLTILDCESNQLTALPPLPPNLQRLYCGSNSITSVSPLPTTIRYLGIVHTNLPAIPALPDTMEFLDVTYNYQFTCFPPIHKITNLYWTWTSINCLSNFISTTNSIPSILNLPICSLFVISGPITCVDTALLKEQGLIGACQWYLNNVAIPGATSYTYSATISGQYTCKVTSACGIYTSSIFNLITNQTITASVTAGGPLTFCLGNSVTLTADSLYSYNFQWKNNGTSISGATKRSYKVTQTGNYTVVVTNTCGSATSLPINCIRVVNPVPIVTAAGSLTFCPPQTISFNANNFAGVTYQWQRNGVSINGATSQSYIATSSGSSYRVLETANGCAYVSKPKKTINNCRKMEDAENNSTLTIQPNPFSNSTTIILPEETDLQNSELIIFDIFGKEVKRMRPDDYNVEFDKENLAAGIYIVKLIAGNELKSSAKMMVE